MQSHIVHPRHKTVRSLFYPTYLFDIFRPGKDQNIHQGGDFVSDNFKTTICYFHNFSVSFFSSSGTRQFHYPDGCQAMGKASFIEAF